MEEKQEKNLSKCTSCQEIKDRIQDGYYPDCKNKKWVNEAGDLWVGRRCPDCVKKNMQGRMKESRAKKKLGV